MKKKLLCVVLVLSILLLTACKPPVEDVNTNRDESIKKENQEEAITKNTVSSDGEMNDIINLFGKQGSLNYKVTYNIKTDLGDFKDESTSKHFIGGNKKLRTDSEMQGIESRIYIVNDVYTSCSKASGDWTCTELQSPPEMEDQSKKIQEDLEDNSADFEVKKIPSKTILNKKTDCYRIITKDTMTADYCFSPEGVPLYVKVEGPGLLSEQIATSYSMSVQNSDFVPPVTAEKMDLPDDIPEDILAMIPT